MISSAAITGGIGTRSSRRKVSKSGVVENSPGVYICIQLVAGTAVEFSTNSVPITASALVNISHKPRRHRLVLIGDFLLVSMSDSRRIAASRTATGSFLGTRAPPYPQLFDRRSP